MHSQEAIEAIIFASIKLQTHFRVHRFANRLSRTNNIIVAWVLGHSGIDRNEMPDRLAKVGPRSYPMNDLKPYFGVHGWTANPTMSGDWDEGHCEK